MNLIFPNANSESKLQSFIGATQLRTRISKSNLKEISEHQSMSSSREVSLEQIDENQKGVPKGYINLRKSFKSKTNSEVKSKHKKSTFKIRKNKSSLRGSRVKLFHKF